MHALSPTWLTSYPHTEKLLSVEGGREGGITPQPGTVRVWPYNCRLEPRLTRAAQNHAYKRLKLLIIIIFLTTKRWLFKAQTFKMWFSHNIRKESSKSAALVCCRNAPRAADNLFPDQLETLLFLQPVGSAMSANNIFTLRKLSVLQRAEETAAQRALSL